MGGHGEMKAKNADDASGSKQEGHLKRAFSKVRHPARWKAIHSADAMAAEVREKTNTVGTKAEDLRDRVEGKMVDVREDISPPFGPAPADADLHPTTSTYAASVGYTMAKQVALYLHEDEGQEILTKMFLNQALVVGDVARQLLLSEDFQRSCRMMGLELASGASETVEKRLVAAWEKVPRFISVSILSLAVVSGGLLVTGFSLALWRFALFGLQ